MKRTLSIFLVLLFIFQLMQSQINEPLTEKSTQEVYDYYNFKAKKQKKTGWILLGVGLAATAGGYAIMANNFSIWSNESDGGFAAGSGLFLVGGLATIASIPVLIVSGSNNRKAKAYMETGSSKGGDITLKKSRNVAVGLKIEF